MTDESLDALHGRVIDGRYTLQRPLGQGGMGAVYTATQASMQRVVAIKLIAPRLITDVSVTKRFLREAQLSGRIAHPHVVSVFDSGRTDDGLHYLVMERIEGRTLADAIAAEAPFEPARAVRIAAQICDGLAAAHAQDVAHRDLKPANIMLVGAEGAEGVKILDFGLARCLAGELSMLTETGVMFGTPTYMPPEVARGQNCDGRGDLYALGVILFEMLSGAPPFSGNHPLALAMHHANTPPPLLPDAVPQPLAMLVERLLAKTPDARPATADMTRALLAASLQAASKPAVPARIDSLRGLSVPPQSRARPVAWAVIGALILGAGAWLALRDPDAARLPAPASASPTSTPSASRAPQAPETAAPASAAPATAAPSTTAPGRAASAAPATQAPPSAAPQTRAPAAARPATRAPRRRPPKAPVTAAPATRALPGSFIRP